ncbi:MAG: DUF4430 domain-containing protein [Patescibacteria group bacterium]|jgi:hypothetical protein
MKKLAIFIILILIIGAIFYFWEKNSFKNDWEHNPKIPQEEKKNNLGQPPYETYTYWTLSFQFSESEIVDNIKFEMKKSIYDDISVKSPLSLITEAVAKQQNWDFEYEDYGSMGILVTKIRDKKNGQDQKYWQFFVDGEQPQISVDKYFPQSDTKIQWKFIESEL